MTSGESALTKVRTIRFRTWSLTLSIIIALVFYLLMNVVFREVDIVKFGIVATIQILAHFLYFPEGENSGMLDVSFVNNRKAYNDKATEINKNKQTGELKEYCEYEYEQRKHEYILNELGKIGISEPHFERLKQLSESQIKRLESAEWDGKLYHFTKKRRKRLYALIYKDLPIKKTDVTLVLSAVENSAYSAIKDYSIKFRNNQNIKRFLKSLVIGGVFAYVGYTVKDGVGLAEIAEISAYLTTLLSTAVMSFSSGETCTKVYKSHFYVDLVNFIDSFNEWRSKKGEKLI